jgi:hypothetical protein
VKYHKSVESLVAIAAPCVGPIGPILVCPVGFAAMSRRAGCLDTAALVKRH